MRTPVKRLLISTGFAVILVAGLAVWLYDQYQDFLETPLKSIQARQVLLVERGDTIRSVVAKLEQQETNQLDWKWRLLTRLHPVTIRAGEYSLETGLTAPEFLNLLASGKVVTYRFTIVEGWTVWQLLDQLAADPVLKHTLTSTQDIATVNQLPAGYPEGWFLPETYVFIRGDSDVDILRRSHEAMQSALDMVWSSRAEDLPYETPYELLIMASIVEKETSQASERPDIAGVFVRRLQKKWRLETDPTVIYGIGESYDGDIRRSDLKTDTPYNTYTRFGLPPTPISLPGLGALQGSAHPADGEAMFFVADGKGGHTFSTTLDEHNRAVRTMLKMQASQRSQPDQPPENKQE
jgi:UPF0755 protein